MILAAAPCIVNSHGFIGVATQWVVTLMDAIGVWGVALGIAIETVFPFMPSEVLLPLAGFTAATGRLELIPAIFWATVGSVVGSWVLYGVARWIGIKRLRVIADKIPGMSAHDIDVADKWFVKYDTWSVLIGRCVPVVRSLISVPAGFGKMPLWSFTLWTAIGSGVWNICLMYAGFALGAKWCQILGVLETFQWFVIAIILVLIALFIYWWIKRIKQTDKAKLARKRNAMGKNSVRSVKSTNSTRLENSVSMKDGVQASHSQNSAVEAGVRTNITPKNMSSKE